MAVKSKKILDISKVPVEHTRLAWLAGLFDANDFSDLIISKEQAASIFISGVYPWTSYRAVPISIK